METRKQVGPDYRLMIDCYMALDVPYSIDLANAVREANLFWIEEALPPHDLESHKYIKKACPWQKWSTGEHTNTRYGFRKIIEDRSVDILQPDALVMGGVTEFMNMYSRINLAEQYIKVFGFEFGFYYMKIKVPGGTLFGDKGTLWANMGISKKILNDSATISLSIDNLFDSGGFSIYQTKALDLSLIHI